ncbi:sulfate ABC transporter, permease protein CysW [Opitutaceae bacterium TAV1]|nr:sulfate ABC transporter, permease protein CysW [Opitutaceae bacterium TAV1]
MASAATSLSSPASGALAAASRRTTQDSRWVRWTLTSVALLFLAGFLVLPLASVFAEAFRKGIAAYLEAFNDPDTGAALRLTLIAAGISVPANLVFGVAASWAIAKFNFPGKSILITLIDLPFAVSPVIAGLIYVLVFGLQGWFPPESQAAFFAPVAGIVQRVADVPGLGWLFGGLAGWLANPQVIFATPGIVLATIFVTFPFVARELIPLMQAQGNDEEYAAITLGANGWQTFWHVTRPNIKWGLFYGIILCNARAMGEFGAVSVVSGHIRGETNTLPLHVEIMYNEYQFVGAFAVASVLALLAIVTLVLKSFVEWRFSENR